MQSNEYIRFSRDCKAVLVPDGTETTIAEGMEGRITQALGGSITIVTQYGQMFRLLAKDADAIGKESSEFETTQEETGGSLEERVWSELATCYDPEIPVSIVELGLVYHCKVEQEDGKNIADVKMTLTAPGCGMGEVLVREVKETVIINSRLKGVRQ